MDTLFSWQAPVVPRRTLRTPTDNDRKLMAGRWREAGLDCLSETPEQVIVEQVAADVVQIKVQMTTSAASLRRMATPSTAAVTSFSSIAWRRRRTFRRLRVWA